jgi:hypothetical protein
MDGHLICIQFQFCFGAMIFKGQDSLFFRLNFTSFKWFSLPVSGPTCRMFWIVMAVDAQTKNTTLSGIGEPPSLVDEKKVPFFSKHFIGRRTTASRFA